MSDGSIEGGGQSASRSYPDATVSVTTVQPSDLDSQLTPTGVAMRWLTTATTYYSASLQPARRKAPE